MRFIVIVLLFGSIVAGFAFAAKFLLRESVEAEMAERSLATLREAGFEGVQVDFDHLSGTLGGYVDSVEQISEVAALLREAMPGADWPQEEDLKISIRPTLPPYLKVVRAAESEEVRLEGILGAGAESHRSLIGSRLHAVPAVAVVDNSIVLDPRRLEFSKMAEFASLAVEMLSHSGEAELKLQEGELTLSGTVPNDGVKAGLLEIAARIVESAPVDRIVVKLPDVLLRYSELRITRNRFGISLSGVVPSEAARPAILEALSGLKGIPQIVDRLEVRADYAESDWQERIRAALPGIMNSLTGEMTGEFRENQIRLHGSAASEGDRETVLAAIQTLAGTSGDIEVIADVSLTSASDAKGGGFRLVAEFEGGLLSLKGTMPDGEFSKKLTAMLANSNPDWTIKEELEIIPENRENSWVRARLADFLVEVLARVDQGALNFSGESLEMQGNTLALPDRQLLQNVAVNTVPANFAVNNQLIHADQPFPKPALLPEAATKLAEELKQFPVYFDMGSDTVKSDQREKVSSIGELVKDLDAPVELVVTGVSDSVGNPESNRQLSLRRANSVIQELVRLGVSEEALGAVSVIENVTGRPRSEQWKSRRVEVSLKTPEPDGSAATQP